MMNLFTYTINPGCDEVKRTKILLQNICVFELSRINCYLVQNEQFLSYINICHGKNKLLFDCNDIYCILDQHMLCCI